MEKLPKPPKATSSGMLFAWFCVMMLEFMKPILMKGEDENG